MPTIKDVAEACGVSSATVSYVFNNTGSVNVRTRERILDTARRMGYRPSAIARGLARRRMETLGIFFNNPAAESLISEPYLGPVLDGVVMSAHQMQQKIMLIPSVGNRMDQAEFDRIWDGHCDGLVIAGTAGRDELIEMLLARNVNFVTISSHSETPGVSSVNVDNLAGGTLVGDFLRERGHRRIVAIREERVSDADFEIERILGARSALTPVGGSVTLCRGLRRSETFKAKIVAAARGVGFPEGGRPTALFPLTHMDAATTIEALTEQGIRIPDDISVIGFDDLIASPPLTVVRQPLRAMGEQAARMLVARIRSEAEPGEKVILPVELVDRGSVATLTKEGKK